CIPGPAPASKACWRAPTCFRGRTSPAERVLLSWPRKHATRSYHKIPTNLPRSNLPRANSRAIFYRIPSGRIALAPSGSPLRGDDSAPGESVRPYGGRRPSGGAGGVLRHAGSRQRSGRPRAENWLLGGPGEKPTPVRAALVERHPHGGPSFLGIPN